MKTVHHYLHNRNRLFFFRMKNFIQAITSSISLFFHQLTVLTRKTPGSNTISVSWNNHFLSHFLKLKGPNQLDIKYDLLKQGPNIMLLIIYLTLTGFSNEQPFLNCNTISRTGCLERIPFFIGDAWQ